MSLKFVRYKNKTIKSVQSGSVAQLLNKNKTGRSANGGGAAVGKV